MNSQSANPCPADTALWALVQLARHYRIAACAETLAHQHSREGRPLDEEQLQHAAMSLGFDTRIQQVQGTLHRMPMPAIARDRLGHACILWRQAGGRVWMQGISDSKPFPVSFTGLRTRIDSPVLWLRPKAHTHDEQILSGFQWCWPVIIKYRYLLARVLVAGMCLLSFSLVTPLFFQVVMDKVLVHHSLATLGVVVLGLVAVMVFESLFSAARYWLFAFPLAQIDASLKADLFDHLMSVAPGFFIERPVGELASRLREMDTVRDFLTHHCLAVVLDGVFSVAFLAVMFAYSPALTAIVVGSLLAYAAIALIVGPLLHRQATHAQALAADNQAFLVETVNAVRTLKGVAAEPWAARHWDDCLTQATKAQRKLGMTGAYAQELIGLVGKLVTAATLWWGARAVMSGDLTLGGFIAFNLFAARVAQPALRLGQVWAQYQQAKVALRRLAVILAQPAQGDAGAKALPRLEGRIQMDSVSFGYGADSCPVLDRLTFSIPPGQCVGITGQSGSGKSTLLKLLLGFVTPHKGQVRLDGNDIAMADPTSLRRQIGVVMQQPFLLQGSVHENIALGQPGASRCRVIEAAKLAGAHGFVERLPEGYETELSEGGADLSGGQRQRLAIARALLANPRILIFDEATSALDDEAQAHLEAAMPALCEGRTVLIIAHRLETLQRCDRLLVLEQGHIVEDGSPQALACLPQGYYARLLRLQREGMA